MVSLEQIDQVVNASSVFLSPQAPATPPTLYSCSSLANGRPTTLHHLHLQSPPPPSEESPEDTGMPPRLQGSCRAAEAWPRRKLSSELGRGRPSEPLPAGGISMAAGGGTGGATTTGYAPGGAGAGRAGPADMAWTWCYRE